MRFLLFFFLLFVSCEATQELAMPKSTYDRSQSRTRQYKSETELDERLMIYEAYMGLRVKDLEAAADSILNKLPAYNAYVQSSSDYRYSIKVPNDRYERLLQDLSGRGEVEYENRSATDVTDAYRDIEVRLETLEKARQRYLELLDQATQVSEILEIEKELERVNLELDSLKASIQRYDNRIEYSLLVLELRAKVRPGPLGYIGLGIFKVVKWLFVWN
ncbi:MAG: DUF4349 domain-containing protein [Bacteroidota bacterium]